MTWSEMGKQTAQAKRSIGLCSPTFKKKKNGKIVCARRDDIQCTGHFGKTQQQQNVDSPTFDDITSFES